MRQRMRKYLISLAAMSPIALAACGEAPDESAASDAAEVVAFDGSTMQAEAAPRADAGGPVPDLGAIEVGMPKLAYTYDYAFRTSGERRRYMPCKRRCIVNPLLHPRGFQCAVEVLPNRSPTRLPS